MAGAQRALVDPELIREVTARSFVLLSNPRGLLPVPTGSVQRLALIGPNAVDPQTQGGGSVRVLPVAGIRLAEALGDAFDALVTVNMGCLTSATTAAPTDGSLDDPVSGDPGVRLQVRVAGGAIVHDTAFPGSTVTWWDGLPEAVHLPGSEGVMRGSDGASSSGTYIVGAAWGRQLRVVHRGILGAEATPLASRHEVASLFPPP